MTIENQTASPC